MFQKSLLYASVWKALECECKINWDVKKYTRPKRRASSSANKWKKTSMVRKWGWETVRLLCNKCQGRLQTERKGRQAERGALRQRKG